MDIPAETKMSQDLQNFPEGLTTNYYCNIHQFQFPGPVLRAADPRTQQAQPDISLIHHQRCSSATGHLRTEITNIKLTHTSFVFLCLSCKRRKVYRVSESTSLSFQTPKEIVLILYICYQYCLLVSLSV